MQNPFDKLKKARVDMSNALIDVGHVLNMLTVAREDISISYRLVKEAMEDAVYYYVLTMEEDIYPALHGPFRTDEERDEHAKWLKQLHPDDYGIYYVQFSGDGSTMIGGYNHGYLSGGFDD